MVTAAIQTDSECPHAIDDNAAEVLLYACKTIGRGEQLLLDYGEEYRGHDWSQAQPQQVRVRRRCEHGRQRYYCKKCGGGGICKHNRERSQCKECGGGGICQHNRQRSQCKTCRGKINPKTSTKKNSKEGMKQKATKTNKTTKKTKQTKSKAK